MPKKLERKYKRMAKGRGLKPGTEDYNAFLYGKLRKTGWKPSRERK